MATPIVIGGKQIGKIKASFLLFKETFRFFSTDKEMLVIPFVTGFVLLTVIGSACFLMIVNGFSFAAYTEETPLTGKEYLYVFLFYILCAFTVACTQAAITHIVYTRVRGGDATLGQGLGVAWKHAPALFVWATITSTVGILLRFISERSQLLTRIVVALIGAVWSVLTYFVVSAIVIDNKSPLDAIQLSSSVFRRTWGETLVVNISLGFVFMFGLIGFVIALFGLWMIMGGGGGALLLCAVIFLVGLFFIALFSSVLDSVLRTLLYVYASDGTVPANFNPELLEHMLARKGRVPPHDVVGVQ